MPSCRTTQQSMWEGVTGPSGSPGGARWIAIVVGNIWATQTDCLTCRCIVGGAKCRSRVDPTMCVQDVASVETPPTAPGRNLRALGYQGFFQNLGDNLLASWTQLPVNQAVINEQRVTSRQVNGMKGSRQKSIHLGNVMKWQILTTLLECRL